jgi:hypothetical protein
MLTIKQKVFRVIGNKLIKASSEGLYSDMEPSFKDIFFKCKNYTMTSPERMYSLYKSTEYVLNNNIPGDIVECGVWRGGSSMVCALTMMKMQSMDRKIYLYDTYSGMSEPTEKDVDFEGSQSIKKWKKMERDNHNKWDYASLAEVKNNMQSTKYPDENIIYIKGKVENTIPNKIPEKISILRLDTDWYESTYHELIHLFPLLSKNGVLIIDDYGHWQGSKEAVDNYIEENKVKILLNRVDYTGRIGIKTKY